MAVVRERTESKATLINVAVMLDMNARCFLATQIKPCDGMTRALDKSFL